MSKYEAYVQKTWGSLIGRTIVSVRELNNEELDLFGWEQDSSGSVPVVYILDNGLGFVPSQDPEGNGPGHIFVEEMSA